MASSECIQVDPRNVGRIIGSRGSKIRELQDESQAHIQVSREPNDDGQTDVTISGTMEQINNAKELINQCLNRDSRNEFSKSNRSSDFGGGGQRGRKSFHNDQGSERSSWRDNRNSGFNDQGSERSSWRDNRNSGFNDQGSERSSWRDSRENQQEERNDSWEGKQNGVNRRGGGRSDRGTARGGFGFSNDSRDNRQEERNDSWEGRQNGGNRRGGRNNRDASGFSRGEYQGDGNKEEIFVLSIEVGRLIGSGGTKIRELQSDSNCKIKVSRDGSNGTNMVELFGSPEQIEEAKSLISKAVDIVARDGSRIGGEDEPEPVEIAKPAKIDWGKVYMSSQERAKEKFKDLPPIIKKFYEEVDDIACMRREEAAMIRRDNNNIMVECPDSDTSGVFPNPIKVFEDAFHNYPLILEQIYKQKFVKPSPIQCQSWPVLLQGKDLIGIAQTGTGKTLAFLLPALVHIDNQPVPREERSGPSALILSPTRELAQQIETEVNKINYKGIRSICVYGGGDRREQKAKCQQGVEIVVATPGRLNDFMNNGIIDVTNVTYLVMDEADRMLDLGFELEIKKVMMDIRPDRQTVMTSATWPDEVQHLADKYMTDPYKVFVGTLDLAAVHSVKQYVEICQDYEKKDMLSEFIQAMGPTDKVIVFVGKKIVADDLSSDLAMAGIVCQCIHGDREQCDREAALSEFKDSVVRILVATDVASRGLDVPDITHVINFDFPRHIEEYVHRIGRTGRAGRSGTAVTFVTRGDWKSAQQLIDIMTEAGQEIPSDLVSMAERYSSFKQRRDEEGFTPGMRGGRGRGGRGRGGRGGRGRRRDDDEGIDFFM